MLLFRAGALHPGSLSILLATLVHIVSEPITKYGDYSTGERPTNEQGYPHYPFVFIPR